MEAVTEVKRAHGIAAITLSDESVIKVPSALFLERRVRVGQLIDREAYEQFIKQRAYPFALDRAVKLLSLRECAEGEVARKLQFAGYDGQVIARVLQTLVQNGLISDARFAGLYALSRSQKHGKNRIYQELKRKGVSGDTARQALATIDDEEELEAAKNAARKLLKNKPDTADTRRKALAALARRGFSYDMAKKALEAARSADDAEADEWEIFE